MTDSGAGTWASLSLYESPELARRLAEEKTGRRPTTAKAREISAHFSQAREYFRGAPGAAELVRPLIVYYGAAALARGAALFLDAGKSKLVAGHGLDASGWPDLLTRPDALADSAVKVGSDGTFPELARVTANTERVRVQAEESPGVADAYSPGSAPAEGDAITVKEILGQIPDVVALYETTFSEHSRRLRSEVSYTGLPETRKPGEEIPPDENTRRHAWLGIVRTPIGYPPEGWAEGLVEAGGHGTLGRGREEGFFHFARVPHQAFIVVVSPGTGVLYTVATGLGRGFRESVVASFGCTLGIVPHMAAAIAGLAAILHTSAVVFETFKYLGVAYLLYMAWNTLREQGALQVENNEEGYRSAARVMGTAVLINFLNPKLSIFFLAFLPQFVSTGEENSLGRMLGLSAVFMLMTFLVFVVYGLFAGAVRDHVISRPRVLTWMRRAFAAAFVGLGIQLALASR